MIAALIIVQVLILIALAIYTVTEPQSPERSSRIEACPFCGAPYQREGWGRFAKCDHMRRRYTLPSTPNPTKSSPW